jgi:hypothetical protein
MEAYIKSRLEFGFEFNEHDGKFFATICLGGFKAEKEVEGSLDTWKDREEFMNDFIRILENK